MTVPEAFYDQPDIGLQWLFHWQAFHDLSTERQIGMGVGPIPRSAIRSYAEEYGIIEDDEYDKFEQIIRSVDVNYLKLVNSFGKKDAKATVPIHDVDGVKEVMSRLKARSAKPPRKQQQH